MNQLQMYWNLRYKLSSGLVNLLLNFLLFMDKDLLHDSFILTGNYIIIDYNSPIVESVAKMCLEHYDRIEYQNSVLIINYVPIKDLSYMDRYIGKRLIFYQLEHLTLNHPWHPNVLFPFLYNYFSEIWEFEIQNFNRYPIELIDRVKFVPLRYTSAYEDIIIPNNEKTIDYLFIGSMDFDRIRSLNRLLGPDQNSHVALVLRGKNIFSSIFELSISKHYLDLHHYAECKTQNQVRIFEALLLGKSVVSVKSSINYFGNLITEIDEDDLFNSDISIPTNIRERYKALTHTDKAYDQYKLNFQRYLYGN